MRERPSGWIFSISGRVGTCDVALTKTSIMLGLGESDENIRQTLRDIREIDLDVVKFGQYLQPSKRHLSVKEYATLKSVKNGKRRQKIWVSNTLRVAHWYLRSSYKAGEFFLKNLIKEKEVAKEGALIGQTG
eukprot:scaffold2727_cov275-Chaetoceros_neogracile.AAC.6